MTPLFWKICQFFTSPQLHCSYVPIHPFSSHRAALNLPRFRPSSRLHVCPTSQRIHGREYYGHAGRGSLGISVIEGIRGCQWRWSQLVCKLVSFTYLGDVSNLLTYRGYNYHPFTKYHEHASRIMELFVLLHGISEHFQGWHELPGLTCQKKDKHKNILQQQFEQIKGDGCLLCRVIA